MRRGLLERNLELYYKEIFEKYNIIKEIDILNDIDTKSSDRFKINSQKGYLEFLCKDITVVKSSDYSVILGKIKEKEDYSISLVSSIENITQDSLMRAYLLIERKVLFSETDVVIFDVERSNEFAFNIGFNNYSRYKWMNMIKSKEIDFYKENKDRVSFMSTFSEDKVILDFVTGKDKTMIYSIDIEDTTSIQYIINFRDNYVKLKEKKYKIPYVKSLAEKDISYINIALLPIKEQEKTPQINIKDIVYGEEQGYVYFSFNLKDYSFNNIGIICIASTSLHIQIYSHVSKKWQDLNEASCKVNHKDIQIRIKMKCGDRLYKILIAQLE